MEVTHRPNYTMSEPKSVDRNKVAPLGKKALDHSKKILLPHFAGNYVQN